MLEINTWECIIRLLCLQNSHLAMCRFLCLRMIMFCDFAFLCQMVLSFSFHLTKAYRYLLPLISLFIFFLIFWTMLQYINQPTSALNPTFCRWHSIRGKKRKLQKKGKVTWFNALIFFQTHSKFSNKLKRNMVSSGNGRPWLCPFNMILNMI